MKIGLIGIDSKLPNFALQKCSTWAKQKGYRVFLNEQVPLDADKVFFSVLFPKNRRKVEQLASAYSGEVLIGGTGWDLDVKLPPEIEACSPDYSLYTPEIVYERNKSGRGTKEGKMAKSALIASGGLGFIYRGCVRNNLTCPWCLIPRSEPVFQRVTESVRDIYNPNGRLVTLLDNNLLAAPDALEILNQIKADKKIINITQGLDLRLLTPELAEALGQQQFFRAVSYAWDHPNLENLVRKGVELLSQFVGKKRQLCYMLIGHETSSWEADYYRFETLAYGLDVDPYVMPLDFNSKQDLRMKHFARFVNGRVYKAQGCSSFENYKPWQKVRDSYFDGNLFDLAPV